MPAVCLTRYHLYNRGPGCAVPGRYGGGECGSFCDRKAGLWQRRIAWGVAPSGSVAEDGPDVLDHR